MEENKNRWDVQLKKNGDGNVWFKFYTNFLISTKHKAYAISAFVTTVGVAVTYFF